MNRDYKIQRLKAVMCGQLNPTSLQPSAPYIFITRNDEPGTYEMLGKKYNQLEFEELCKKAERKKNIITQICVS